MTVKREPQLIDLLDNEIVVRVLKGHYFKCGLEGGSYNILYGQLVLTDQRIGFFETLRSQTMAFPLSRITHIGHTALPLGQRFDVIKVEFDNGGVEYLGVDDPAEWIRTLDTARKIARRLDYEEMPSLEDGVENSRRLGGQLARYVILMYLGLAAIAVITCLVLYSVAQLP